MQTEKRMRRIGRDKMDNFVLTLVSLASSRCYGMRRNFLPNQIDPSKARDVDSGECHED